MAIIALKRQFTIVFIIFGALMSFSQETSRFSFSRDSILINDPSLVEELVVYRGYLDTITKPLTPVLGTKKQWGDQFAFYPYVPFNLDSPYTLFFKDGVQLFSIPQPEGYEQLSVKVIYPKTKAIPANFLKWYIRFSRPVNASRIYEHIRITDLEGNDIDRALLPLLNPLISEDKTLLTLWVEPGRQKRDLGPNTRLGAVFEEGKKYNLIIEGLKDQNGVLMDAPVSHSFAIIKADRIKPDSMLWTLRNPTAGTQDPLYIDCNEILDYGSLQDAIHITTSEGIEISGTLEWVASDKSIQFIPSFNWIKDDYTILFNKTLEDISGNNLERLFDNDIKNRSEDYHPQIRSFRID